MIKRETSEFHEQCIGRLCFERPSQGEQSGRLCFLAFISKSIYCVLFPQGATPEYIPSQESFTAVLVRPAFDPTVLDYTPLMACVAWFPEIIFFRSPFPVRTVDDVVCLPDKNVISSALVKDDLKTPVDGLVSRVDYRGVNPAVWFLYLEMYGKDSAHDLCRRVLVAGL